MSNAPLEFEVECGSTHLGGKLILDGREIRVDYASCDLFNGCLNLRFTSREIHMGLCRVPFGDAIAFSELPGRAISDGTRSSPGSRRNRSLYIEIGMLDLSADESLQVDEIAFQPDAQVLSLHLKFNATELLSGAVATGEGWLTADCKPVDARWLIHSCSDSFDIKFARIYLPMVGLPVIPVGATRDDVAAMFGRPFAQGGGTNPVLGEIPYWVRYRFPLFDLWMGLESESIRDIRISSNSDSFEVPKIERNP